MSAGSGNPQGITPVASDAVRKRALPALAPFFDNRVVKAIVTPSPRPGWLGGMRVRKKLIVLHTVFTLLLALVLVLVLRPAVSAVVREAEVEKSRMVLGLARYDSGFLASGRLPASLVPLDASVRVMMGDAQGLGLSPRDTLEAIAAGATPGADAVSVLESALGPGAIVYLGPEGGPRGAEARFMLLAASVPEARSAVTRLYALVGAGLLGAYLLVALALELFVLPRTVYGPIRRMLDADAAVQAGRKESELISQDVIPSDELGSIMRSRNDSIVKLRRQERELERAFASMEEIASDLRRKNHLLEAAKRNLADADRLASLGMMSAGIAHELNTPLAVVKGLTERMHSSPGTPLYPSDVQLMLRVVRRLERLSDSLLDYARVRPPSLSLARPHELVEEAGTLVRLDRGLTGIVLANLVPPDLELACDADRIVQVLVNLIRNAVDSLRQRGPSAGTGEDGLWGRVHVTAQQSQREGRTWLALSICDDGPGIDPSILPRLFEPFATTRLDSRGTGLGLAVAEGIAREHGGTIVARNRKGEEPGAPPSHSGAVFELWLPMDLRHGSDDASVPGRRELPA